MERLASLTSMSFLASSIHFAEAGDIKAFVIQKNDSSVVDIISGDELVLKAAHLDEEDGEEFLFRSPKFDDDYEDEDEDEDDEDEDEDFDDEDED